MRASNFSSKDMIELMLESESLDTRNGNCVRGFFVGGLVACGVAFQDKIRTYCDTKSDVYARPK